MIPPRAKHVGGERMLGGRKGRTTSMRDWAVMRSLWGGSRLSVRLRLTCRCVRAKFVQIRATVAKS
jgi:hypothetical protein